MTLSHSEQSTYSDLSDAIRTWLRDAGQPDYAFPRLYHDNLLASLVTGRFEWDTYSPDPNDAKKQILQAHQKFFQFDRLEKCLKIVSARDNSLLVRK